MWFSSLTEITIDRMTPKGKPNKVQLALEEKWCKVVVIAFSKFYDIAQAVCQFTDHHINQPIQTPWVLCEALVLISKMQRRMLCWLGAITE